MTVRSAGLLAFRLEARGDDEVLRVFLVHPGGPVFAARDVGVWSIPKGEVEDAGDDLRAVARREFEEETGQAPPDGQWIELGEVRQSSAKQVVAWAVEGDVDAERLESNTFEMEWPPRSGRVQRFPEIDRGAWFDLVEARARVLRGQVPLLDRLVDVVSSGRGRPVGEGRAP